MWTSYELRELFYNLFNKMEKRSKKLSRDGVASKTSCMKFFQGKRVNTASQKIFKGKSLVFKSILIANLFN